MKNKSLFLFFLFSLYLIIRLLLISYVPFVRDEALYVQMINEQIEDITFIPTYLGHPMDWKPPVFFWVYSFFVRFLITLPLSDESIYRLPTVIFGFLNIFIVFFLSKKLSNSTEVAKVVSIIYSFNFLVIYMDNTVLIDTLLNFFILLSFYLYLRTDFGNIRFFPIIILSSLAFFTKLAVAFIIPALAVVYFLVYNKNQFSNIFFILSLFSVPLSAIIYSSLDVFAGGEQLFISTGLITTFNNFSSTNIVTTFYGSFIPFMLTSGIWFFLSVMGFFKYCRKNPFISFWFMLILIPFLISFFMPWYFLPVMFPVSYFSALVLLYNEKNKITLDNFFKLIFLLFIVVSFILGFWFYDFLRQDYEYNRIIGREIAGFENVLFIGDYNPEIIIYKVLKEKRSNQEFDYGWILFSNITRYDADDFVNNYWNKHDELIDGSFTSMFRQKNAAYRKDTNITTFDYIILLGVHSDKINGNLIKNESNVSIFKIK